MVGLRRCSASPPQCLGMITPFSTMLPDSFVLVTAPFTTPWRIVLVPLSAVDCSAMRPSLLLSPNSFDCSAEKHALCKCAHTGEFFHEVLDKVLWTSLSAALGTTTVLPMCWRGENFCVLCELR